MYRKQKTLNDKSSNDINIKEKYRQSRESLFTNSKKRRMNNILNS